MPRQATRTIVKRIAALLIAFANAKHGFTIPDLIEETGMSRRTVYRYLVALEDAGIRLERRKLDADGKRVRYRALDRLQWVGLSR